MTTRYFMPALAVAALLAAGLASGCSDDDPNEPNPPPASADVTATNGLTFNPASVQVATGGEVTWEFEATGHNVTFDAVAGAPADIGGSNADVSISRTFAAAGTFPYVCTIHPGMSGSVQVVAP
ncbi:MAG TPA: plastocyanin/azurin family copper-binding protein [Gemmatimonadales bacterium]|nr:plastocyanin/azurin family copper-binding protein [Gemmatimonadales bacterium]